MPLSDARSALPEERKTVSVLFADLVGFTSRVDRRDPEDVRGLLDPYFRLLHREVERIGGTVEKYIGDGLMAVWGVPAAHEDDPERAVRAALAIRDAVLERGEARGFPELSVRIGVNTGEALVKPEVPLDRGERIVADFVNVAARLQTSAPVNGVLVGENTYLATARTIEYQAFEPVRVKGKAEPVLAWQAVAARSRVGADPQDRGRAPLVGRQAELEELCAAFARTRYERSSQLVTLIGPPGIGKTRLVNELSSVVEDDPELVSWRRGVCLPYGEGVTFWPLAEMVKAQGGILESDSAEEVEDKLGREVAESIEDEDEAAWVRSHLRTLLGLAPAAESVGDRRESFAAWRRFLEALADGWPLVLVFEDLHWADEGLLDFIDHLVEWAAAVPLLIVCTARPELLARRPGWGTGRPNATTLALSPLSDVETSALLDGLLERAVLPADLVPKLLASAGGNPLYAEEFVRMLGERGVTSAVDELPVPQSVRGIIAARLDTLPAEEKRTLQDAAVLGRTFWLGAIAHLCGDSAASIEERLRSLERKEFVRRERRSTVEDEIEYTIRHLLVREVAYERMPRARRIDKHQLAAEWIESLGRPEANAETFAYHYSRALELARAAGQDTSEIESRARHALAEAGDRAAALKSFTAAASLYAAAAELWPRDDPEWASLRFRQGRAIYWAEEGGAAVLGEVLEELLATGDNETAAEAELMLGRIAFREGRGEATMAHYQRALDLLDGAPASPAKARVLGALARHLMLAAESTAAISAAREALAMAEELGLEEIAATAWMTIGDARIEHGEIEGLADCERGIAMADELSSFEAITGRVNLADSLTDLGQLERAAELRLDAEHAAERFGDVRSLRWLRAELAGQAYSAGHWDEALEILDDFIAESCAPGQRHYQEGYARVTRARIRLARGEAAGALEDAERAAELGREACDPQALYPALACQARVLIASGQVERGAQVAEELLGLVSHSGETPVAYIWLHELAVVLAELGRGVELAAATAEVRKRTPWLEAALALAGGEDLTAAELYDRIGARPDAALARLRAAAALRESGRDAEAATELDRALAFYASVGAAAATSTAAVSATGLAGEPYNTGDRATSSPPSSS
jgi:class 3 adenylate cyclase/tetratricopeptide (TPR) repeat protein